MAYLFREVFSITRPLNLSLQCVNNDFGKAFDLVDSAIIQLATLRDEPQKVIRIVELNFDPNKFKLKGRRVRRRRRMDGETALDEPVESPDEFWYRDGFYPAIDSVLQVLRGHFSESRYVFEAFRLLAPNEFPELVKKFSTPANIQEEIKTFCTMHNIDSYQCADEVFSFASVFQKFNMTLVTHSSESDMMGNEFECMADEEEQLSDAHQRLTIKETRANEKPTFLDSNVRELQFVRCFSNPLSNICNCSGDSCYVIDY